MELLAGVGLEVVVVAELLDQRAILADAGTIVRLLVLQCADFALQLPDMHHVAPYEEEREEHDDGRGCNPETSAEGYVHLFGNNVDVLQISAQLIVIQAVADDKLVADLHRLVTNLEGFVVGVGLEEEGTYLDRGGLQRLQRLEHVGDALTRVDNILDDDDVATLDGIVEADELMNLSGGCRADIGGEFHEGDFVVELDFLHQVAQEHERSVEYPQKDRRLALGIICVETCCHRLDGVVDILSRNHHLETAIVELDNILHV